MVDLKTVQQGGEFLISPGSPMLSNPPQPYAFARYKNERPDPRGNYFPHLSPKHLSPSLVADMFEQHGAFQATCNIITGLNMKARSPNLPHTGIMRARIIDTSSISPDYTYVRENPRPIVARPAQVLAGQESVFDAEIDRRLKEYFNEEGYGIDPYTEVETGPDGEPRMTYRMSDVDQFYDNHRLSNKYQANTELFYRFCNYVLEPYLVHSATIDNFLRHLNSEIIPSLTRLADEGRNVGLERTPRTGASRAARAGAQRRYSQQLKYMLQRLATDASDFYYGKDMALMAHPIFLIQHMQFLILPPPHIELETVNRRQRRNIVTRAERLLNEAGEPPRYANTGQRIIPNYTNRQGGGGSALVPLHHTAAVGPGTAAFSWAFIQERLQNLDVFGILEALFSPLQDDELEITSHRVEDYVEAARRLYGRARTRRHYLGRNNLNYALRSEYDSPATVRQTGEMMRMPYMGNFTRQELNGMKAGPLRDLVATMLGPNAERPTNKAQAIDMVLQYQEENPNLLQGDDAHTVVTANTPIVFEIDLPGLNPMPVGWPEELVFSMMETLSKYRENIAGLNGETFRREEFLSPSINSNFRFDGDAEVEISWYDREGNRQRRYGLTFNKLRDMIRYDPPNNIPNERVTSSARIAYSLLSIADSLYDNIEFNADLSEIIGMINSHGHHNLPARNRDRYEQLWEGLTQDLVNYGYIAAEGEGKHLWNTENWAPNRDNMIELCQRIGLHNMDDFFQYATESGMGMVNLHVNTSSGLSSMFILRETLKQARTKYNYVASADDTAFIYHLLIWCLDNCLGARKQTSVERRSIGDLVKGVFKGLVSREEAGVENAVNQAFAAVNMDDDEQLLMIEMLLEGLDG